LFIALLFFTGICPFLYLTKKPSPFLVHGKGGFIHFYFAQKP